MASLLRQMVEKWKSCPTLWDHMDRSPPGSSMEENPQISPGKNMEWVVTSFSRGSSLCRDGTWVSCTAGRVFIVWAPREVHRWWNWNSNSVSLQRLNSCCCIRICHNRQRAPPGWCQLELRAPRDSCGHGWLGRVKNNKWLLMYDCFHCFPFTVTSRNAELEGSSQAFWSTEQNWDDQSHTH